MNFVFLPPKTKWWNNFLAIIQKKTSKKFLLVMYNWSSHGEDWKDNVERVKVMFLLPKSIVSISPWMTVQFKIPIETIGTGSSVRCYLFSKIENNTACLKNGQRCHKEPRVWIKVTPVISTTTWISFIIEMKIFCKKSKFLTEEPESGSNKSDKPDDKS